METSTLLNWFDSIWHNPEATQDIKAFVLAQVKEDPSLKTIPTVILTTSEAEADIMKSYELQANAYLSKPVQLDAFESLVSSIKDFWLTRVKLPQRPDG